MSSLSALAVIACTVAPAPRNRLPTRDDDDDGKGAGSKKGGTTTPEVPDGADPFLPDGGKPPGKVYAHTKDTLFLFDPLDGTITKVGKFDCVPQDGSGGISLTNDAVIDLAVDSTGNMYGTTFWRFLRVNPDNGSCTVVRTDTKSDQYPNSLSFVPSAPDAKDEILVGYAFNQLLDATIYTQIDVTTGTMTDRGHLNPDPPLNGVEYAISGDLVSLYRDQGRTFAAIKQVSGDATGGNDFLAEVDPATGTLKSVIGNTGAQGFYGLGFWAGKSYGFTSAGGIYQVDMATGSATLFLDAKDQGLPIEFYGAGVTTNSPTAP